VVEFDGVERPHLNVILTREQSLISLPNVGRGIEPNVYQSVRTCGSGERNTYVPYIDISFTIGGRNEKNTQDSNSPTVREIN
jgi:hypothetical protein